ncbi:SDR family NAD(P)-dependent oxidoreductase [Paracoccus sp. (in: a-proteobacteria)]|uniref:SDR family NAD(P)-dependent oxidoreductase n=1 Tax=Paracoccus sp. TaxID=267 RepID=UPI002AFFB0C8|nr:SDR family oxidoreductase [Paracoccus sp. (in: a-proteobacteria)]
MRLAGKTAIVTGAGAGIGRATAELFAREGARVVIAEFEEDAGRLTEADIASAGGTALFIRTDVSDEDSVRAMVAQTVARFGGIDVLYNNVGGSTLNDGPVTTVSNDEFWLKMKVDLFGTWLGCRHVIPHMITGGGGSVINATSITALIGTRNKDAYTCAKGAIIALTQSMAVEFAEHKVRVNAVAPAGTLTERVAARQGNTGRTSIKPADHLLGMSDPLDVAYAVLYLASDELKTTTGHVLKVDSGLSIS